MHLSVCMYTSDMVVVSTKMKPTHTPEKEKHCVYINPCTRTVTEIASHQYHQLVNGQEKRSVSTIEAIICQ